MRIVGDVHGDAAAFAAAIKGAAASGLFVVQLGDLTDHGPDSPRALRLAFGLLDSGTGLFLLGNHDHRLRRALTGRQTERTHGLQATLDQLALAPDRDALAVRALAEIARAPAWAGLPSARFVHAAWHPAMEHGLPPPEAGANRPTPPVARALYGEVSGRSLADGFPERLHGWIDLLPPGLTVFCGHERRDQPTTWPGEAGGQARFLDTGAGKGGYLSWQDMAWDHFT